jgi:hypothetical protein
MNIVRNQYIIIVSLLVVFLTLTCCQKEITYKYLPGLEMYMQDVHRTVISNTEETIYYFIPVSDCNTCQSTFLNLEVLNSLIIKKPKVVVILTGLATGEAYEKAVGLLKSKYEVLTDPKDAVNAYQTGISKPLLIHMKSGKVLYYLTVTDDKVYKARQYLEKI